MAVYVCYDLILFYLYIQTSNIEPLTLTQIIYRVTQINTLIEVAMLHLYLMSLCIYLTHIHTHTHTPINTA